MIRKVMAVVLVLGVCSAGALGGLYAVGVVGIPDAGLADNEWGEVTDERIEVVSTVWIDNPNPGIELEDATVEYDLGMNGVDLATGSIDGVAVPAGNSTTALRTDLQYQQLPSWWVSHVRNDEVSELEADVTAHVSVGPFSGSPSYTHEDEIETDLEAMIEESLAAHEGEHSLSPVQTGSGTQRELVEPTVEIRDTDAEWGEVTENRTELHLTFEVHNPNAYPLPTPALTGEMEFNEQMVAQWDAHEVELLDAAADTTIPPKGTREITFVAEMDNDDVVRWFATHVDNDEVTDAEMRAQLAMTINGETVTIPEDGDAIRCSYDMRTAIFVEQESGLENRSCEVMPWATPDGESLDDLGAGIDLTDWDDESDGTNEAESDDGESDGLFRLGI